MKATLQMHLPSVPAPGMQRPPFWQGLAAQKLATVTGAALVATVTGAAVVGVTVAGATVTAVTTELPRLQ